MEPPTEKRTVKRRADARGLRPVRSNLRRTIVRPGRRQKAGLWRCAGYEGSWVVSNDGGSIKLVRFGAESSKQSPMPPQLKLSRKMIGRRSLLPTSGGWLAGFDAGEFGGGLWWFSRDGSQTIELLSEHVHAIYQIIQTILIQ